MDYKTKCAMEEMKRLLFEIFAAGFQCGMSEKPLAESYEEYWNFLMKMIENKIP